MKCQGAAAMLVVLLLVAAPVLAGKDSPAASGARVPWLSWEKVVAADAEAEPAKADPPLPFHSIEGVSGAPITPMAYICNAGPEGTVFGKPTVAYTFLNLGSRNIHVVSITQPLFRRIELGYAWNCFGLGTLPDDLGKAGLSLGRDHVCLHHFNIRAQVLPEDSFGLPVPAVTVGVHFKYNDGISEVDHELGGALKGIGYDRHSGTDFTLTASKTFPTLAFGRPVILTAGVRNSRAAQLGYLGFGNTCSTTVEGSVAVLPLDNLAIAYEFRQKENPYDEIAGLVGREQNWHVVSASWIVSDNITVTGLWGALGNIANASADGTFGIQIKFEF